MGLLSFLFGGGKKATESGWDVAARLRGEFNNSHTIYKISFIRDGMEVHSTQDLDDELKERIEHAARPFPVNFVVVPGSPLFQDEETVQYARPARTVAADESVCDLELPAEALGEVVAQALASAEVVLNTPDPEQTTGASSWESPPTASTLAPAPEPTPSVSYSDPAPCYSPPSYSDSGSSYDSGSSDSGSSGGGGGDW